MYYSSGNYGPPPPNGFPTQPGMMTINDGSGRQAPFVVYTPMTFEQQMNYRRQYRQQQREYIDKQLKENFPKGYVLVHSILISMICVVEIVLQIVLIAKNGAIYYVANGIWGGIFGIVLAIVTVSMIKYRHAYFYMGSIIMHAFAIFIFLLAFVFINAIALNQYNLCPDQIFFYNTCYNLEMRPITIVCLALGVIAAALCFVYEIYMSFQINGLCNDSRRASRYQQNAYYPNPSTLQSTSFENNNPPQMNSMPKYNI